mmetsp:Transcript_48879/g.130844  ORF Transcript_48879/g.130844 Transcript_48879/m.130844 type:complete len:241 (-) Transcript_48879:907-1629(-)
MLQGAADVFQGEGAGVVHVHPPEDRAQLFVLVGAQVAHAGEQRRALEAGEPRVPPQPLREVRRGAGGRQARRGVPRHPGIAEELLRRRPLAEVRLQAPPDEALRALRQLRWALGGQRRQLLPFGDKLRDLEQGEGVVPGEQHVHNHAEGPEVAPEVVEGPRQRIPQLLRRLSATELRVQHPHDLWCHVLWRARARSEAHHWLQHWLHHALHDAPLLPRALGAMGLGPTRWHHLRQRRSTP